MTGANSVPHWEQKMLHTKKQQILCRKNISLSTGLKVSLACKCAVYRPDYHNVKGGPHDIEF